MVKQSQKRDQYTVVLEDIRSQNKAFGEALALSREETKTQFKEVNKVLDSHTQILDSHTKVLASHTEILASHTEMIGGIMERLEEIKTELRQKVDYSDFAKLEKRVVRLEARRV